MDTIEKTAAYIQGMLGEEVTVAVGHGKMTQEELARVMERMVEGEIQVLVCTTIIETGIDIANVNTLIIEDADRMGLAQLHQIRGRVGRSSRRAYAYLTYRRGKVLNETAEKRLSAIREYAEFGSGFKIAMRRPGDPRGRQYSGPGAVRLFDERGLRPLSEAAGGGGAGGAGREGPRVESVSADLAVSANPARGLCLLPGAADGPVPPHRPHPHRGGRRRPGGRAGSAARRSPQGGRTTSISIALLRAQAAQCGFEDISQKGLVLTFTMKDFDLKRIAALSGAARFKGRILLLPREEKSALSLRLKPGEDVLAMGRKLVEAYQQLIARSPSPAKGSLCRRTVGRRSRSFSARSPAFHTGRPACRPPGGKGEPP